MFTYGFFRPDMSISAFFMPRHVHISFFTFLIISKKRAKTLDFLVLLGKRNSRYWIVDFLLFLRNSIPISDSFNFNAFLGLNRENSGHMNFFSHFSAKGITGTDLWIFSYF